MSRPFRPKQARTAFLQYAKDRHVDTTSLTPRAALDLVVAFYENVDCTTSALDDGDMLLFQWGIYDDGEGARFELDLTRQLMDASAEDDDIRQLHVTLRFATSDATSSLGSGERWCSSRAGLPAFVAFVHGSAPFVALADRTDGVVAIELEEAG